MRDGFTLAGLGKPVVVVVQETFEGAARVHAEGLGRPDLAICAYRHPAPGADVGPDAMRSLALGLLGRIVESITGTKGALR
ncbi:MAG: hypothetical protein EXR31_09215 [Betaproteobacteria bacterium]|nr:hypothetical protein [Betaproteobacteria bacterium]